MIFSKMRGTNFKLIEKTQKDGDEPEFSRLNRQSLCRWIDLHQGGWTDMIMVVE